MKAAAGAAAAAGTAMGAFAASSVKTGMEFDSAMSQVAATMGKTVDEIQDLRSFAQEMGATTAFSATEAAEALNYMALAGYDADQSMEMLPKVLSLAAAGSIDLATASDMVTDAQSALGLTSEETAAMVDQMAKASSKTNTSVAQLGEALLTIGATGKTAAGGPAELNHVLGLLADNGIKGAEGGTHLRNVMLALQTPTDKAAKAMANLGIQAFDSQGNFRDMQDIFMDLQASMDGMSEERRADILNTMFNKTDLAAVNALLGTSAERWDEVGAALENCKGAADTMAATQLDNLQGDVTLFQSALEGAQIAVSDQLTPSLRQFVQFGSEGLSELTTAFREGGLEGAMNSLGGLLSVGLNLITSQIPFFMSAGMQLLGALGTGLIDNLPAITSALLAVVLMLADGLISALPALAGAGAQIIAQLAAGIGAALPELIPKAVEAIFAFLAGLTDGDSLNGLLDAATVLIFGLIDGIGNALPKLLAYAPQIIGNLARGLINAVPRLLSVGGELLLGLMRGILSGIILIPATIVQVVDGLVNGFKDLLGIHSPSTVFAALGMDLIMGLFNGLSALWSIVTGFFANAWAGILGGFSAFQSSLAQSFPLLAAIVQGPIDSIQIILAGLRGVLDGLIQFVTGVFTGNWTQAWEGVKSIFGSIFDSLAALVKQPINAVISIINRAISGINSLKLDIPDWVPILGGKTFGLNIPEIPQLAEGGIVTAPTLLEAGEAGNEAIIPLPELWGNMQELMADTLDNAVSRLADSLDTGNGDDVPSLAGLLDWEPEGPPDNGDDPPPPIVIYYQPHLHFEGGTPSKEDIVEAGRISQEEFNRMAAKWQKDAQRLSLRK